MKKLIVLLILGVFLLSSCGELNQKKGLAECKFKKGEEVLLRPNNIEAIVTYTSGCGYTSESYIVTYFDNLGELQEISIIPVQIKKK